MTRIRPARLRQGLAAAAALVAMATGLAACGTGSSDSSSATDTDANPTLKIAVGSNALNYLPYWVAQSDGLFAKHHVKVDVVNANALAVAPALLTSGQVDLLVSASGQSVAVAATGKQVSIVANLYDYSPRGGAFVGGSKVASIKQLQGMGSNCTLVTTAKGTATYAAAKQYMRAYDIHCKVSALATNALTVAGITSGQADAGTFAAADGAAVVAKGGHYLQNPATMTDAEAKKLVPAPFPALTVTGLKPTLKSKSQAVERFLAAIDDAFRTISSSTPEDLAKSLSRLPYFTGVSRDAMTRTLPVILKAVPTPASGGEITEAAWKAALTSYYKDFDLPGFDPSAPQFAYSKMIDMSYLKAAHPQ
ncbi:ABC transporter substrate-binding protein [Streptomyces sp. CA-249302]|uniref:ABC transporter substrate-binding protein n=1 Tax=Streptomyces sp. CA-249302 TaxID=3240058 RepID=UPI003D907B14